MNFNVNMNSKPTESKVVNNILKYLAPVDEINGFYTRPGFYLQNGATAIPGGVNFTVHSHGATAIELVLFRRNQTEPFAVIPFPEEYKIGNVYSMIVYDLVISDFEYAFRVDGPYEPEKGLIFDKTKYLLDPYAKAVVGQSVWGYKHPNGYQYRARVVTNDFDWGKEKQPLIDMKDLIIYELHVRGFTKHNSSGAKYKGTFAGIMEKIPYLKMLGVNAIELKCVIFVYMMVTIFLTTGDIIPLVSLLLIPPIRLNWKLMLKVMNLKL